MIELSNIKALAGNHVPKYIYNDHFEPGKTPVYYSGPYWDSNEIVAAMDSFLNGKWITAGEKVYKFENEFSKRFKTKHSLKVDSLRSSLLLISISRTSLLGSLLYSPIKLMISWNTTFSL